MNSIQRACDIGVSTFCSGFPVTQLESNCACQDYFIIQCYLDVEPECLMIVIVRRLSSERPISPVDPPQAVVTLTTHNTIKGPQHGALDGAPAVSATRIKISPRLRQKAARSSKAVKFPLPLIVGTSEPFAPVDILLPITSSMTPGSQLEAPKSLNTTSKVMVPNFSRPLGSSPVSVLSSDMKNAKRDPCLTPLSPNLQRHVNQPSRYTDVKGFETLFKRSHKTGTHYETNSSVGSEKPAKARNAASSPPLPPPLHLTAATPALPSTSTKLSGKGMTETHWKPTSESDTRHEAVVRTESSSGTVVTKALPPRSWPKEITEPIITAQNASIGTPFSPSLLIQKLEKHLQSLQTGNKDDTQTRMLSTSKSIHTSKLPTVGKDTSSSSLSGLKRFVATRDATRIRLHKQETSRVRGSKFVVYNDTKESQQKIDSVAPTTVISRTQISLGLPEAISQVTGPSPSISNVVNTPEAATQRVFEGRGEILNRIIDLGPERQGSATTQTPNHNQSSAVQHPSSPAIVAILLRQSLNNESQVISTNSRLLGSLSQEMTIGPAPGQDTDYADNAGIEREDRSRTRQAVTLRYKGAYLLRTAEATTAASYITPNPTSQPQLLLPFQSGLSQSSQFRPVVGKDTSVPHHKEHSPAEHKSKAQPTKLTKKAGRSVLEEGFGPVTPHTTHLRGHGSAQPIHPSPVKLGRTPMATIAPRPMKADTPRVPKHKNEATPSTLKKEAVYSGPVTPKNPTKAMRRKVCGDRIKAKPNVTGVKGPFVRQLTWS